MAVNAVKLQPVMVVSVNVSVPLALSCHVVLLKGAGNVHCAATVTEFTLLLCDFRIAFIHTKLRLKMGLLKMWPKSFLLERAPFMNEQIHFNRLDSVENVSSILKKSVISKALDQSGYSPQSHFNSYTCSIVFTGSQ